jgi:UDPglucose 6-dehydrogenase
MGRRMKIAVIGTGYVGLVSGACLAELGHEVTAYDKDRRKIELLREGEIPIYEPGLAELVSRNVSLGRLAFAFDLASALIDAEAVFIAVGTPSRPDDGRADLTQVFEVADQIASRLRHPCVVVCKSTVPVGTNREIFHRMRVRQPAVRIEVASNPEFLREGSAIEDFMKPDRVVIGTDSVLARATLKAIYRPLGLSEKAMLFTDLESAELIKYAANAFLATKLSYINEIADLCEHVGANIKDVASGIGLDRRIGPKFLQAGPGFGGSCFPKDTRALLQTAREAGVPLHIVSAVSGVNEARKAAMADRVISAMGGSVEGKSVAVLGVTFKPNTDDMREAPSLAIVPALQAAGALVRAHDPEGMEAAARHLVNVEWCDDAYQASEGADGIVVLTEWDEYAKLDLARLKLLMRGRAFVDLRNVFASAKVTAEGFEHFGIGLGAGAPSMAARDAAE